MRFSGGLAIRRIRVRAGSTSGSGHPSCNEPKGRVPFMPRSITKRRGFQLLLCSILAGGSTTSVRAVAAQPKALHEPVPATSPDDPPADAPPPTRRGLQLGVRAGYAVPLGQFEGGTSALPDRTEVRQSNDLSRLYGGQFTLLFEVGAKVQDHIFVGGYLGGGLGGAGSDFRSLCGQSGVSCLTSLFRIGFEGQYHFIPDGLVNPWLGFGIGYEAASFSARGPSGEARASTSGVEFADLILGVDFRLTKQVGFGPVLDVSVAQYGNAELQTNGTIRGGELAEKALHSWLTLGARTVFFP
jgi:hypothetical protein